MRDDSSKTARNRDKMDENIRKITPLFEKFKSVRVCVN